MHTKAAQAPRYFSVSSSPVAPGLYLSHVCQGRACETTASPVCLFAALTGGDRARGCKKLAQVKSD